MELVYAAAVLGYLLGLFHALWAMNSQDKKREKRKE